jgi:hypothetical protein
MRLNDEIILLIMTELASGYPGTATEFSQVDLIDVELYHPAPHSFVRWHVLK